MARNRWLVPVGLVLTLAVALTLLLEPVDLSAGLHGPDGRNYLSLLHSLLFDRDVLLFDDNPLYGQRIIVTSTGYALELHNVGTALAFLPFYALGHLTCLAGGGVCGGDDLPTSVLLSLGNWVYGLVALALIYRLAKTYTSTRWAAVVVGALALGSPFFYYWTRFFNPHMPSVMLVALLVLVWLRTRLDRSPAHWLLMGALAGLAATVASYNIVFLVLPLSDLAWRLRQRSLPLRDGALLLAGTLAGFAPQMVVWRLLFGSFLATPYGQQLFWTQPGLPELLVSSYHGLYTYTPLLLVATLGFIPLYRRNRFLAVPLILAFIAHVYVSSCNIAWWGGASFGARYLLGSLPLLALPLAQLVGVARPRGVILVAMGTCVVWTYGLFLADFGRLVDPGQYIPPVWQLRSLGRVVADLPRLVQRHLLAPRFDASALYALPSSFVLCGLWAGIVRLRRVRWRVAALASVAAPLAVALLLALSGRSSQVEVDRLAEVGLDEYPQGNYDFYDLAEGYWQRGAYRFVRGDLDRARRDFEAARQILPERDWVRFHLAGRSHVPNALEWNVDDHLTLIGWETEATRLTLYWLTGAEVLAPTYRTTFRLTNARGQEVGSYTPVQPDAWRALADEIVRVGYPLPWEQGKPPEGPPVLTIIVYHAGGTQPIGRFEITLDGH